MSKNDGEYELVLGNRQLLSAFFIIVILFGVFFTMGYVVGRNSAPAAAASEPVTTAGRPEAASPAISQPPASPPAQASKEPPPVETKAAVPTETSKPAPKRETPAASSAPENPPPTRAAKPAESPSTVAAINPGPGKMYLQVAAAGQPQAGAVVDTLRQKGFPALLSAGPRADLFRVVVGPFADAATLGKAKADLESAGFHPIVRK